MSDKLTYTCCHHSAQSHRMYTQLHKTCFKLYFMKFPRSQLQNCLALYLLFSIIKCCALLLHWKCVFLFSVKSHFLRWLLNCCLSQKYTTLQEPQSSFNFLVSVNLNCMSRSTWMLSGRVRHLHNEFHSFLHI